MMSSKEKPLIIWEEEEQEQTTPSDKLERYDAEQGDTQTGSPEQFHTRRQLPETGGSSPLPGRPHNDDFFSSTAFEGYAIDNGDNEREGGFKRRVKGGRVAVAKKITAELDSEDEMIVDMREKGIPDREIANTLIEEGRTRYQTKTIHSRYSRIKVALARRQDQRLDDELTDWHEGEDEMLLAAVEQADKVIDEEVEKLKSRRWAYAAKHLAELKPTTNYSSRACKRRFQEIQSDTAKIPPELDDHPEIRADQKAQRILEFVQRQNAQKAAKFEAIERARKEEERAAMDRATRRMELAQKRADTEAKRIERIQKQANKKAEDVANALKKREAAVNKLEQIKRQRAKGDQRAHATRAEHKAFSVEESTATRERNKQHRDEVIAKKLAACKELKPGRKRTGRGASHAMSSMPGPSDSLDPLTPRRSIRDASRFASNKIHKSAEFISDDSGSDDAYDAENEGMSVNNDNHLDSSNVFGTDSQIENASQAPVRRIHNPTTNDAPAMGEDFVDEY